MSERKVTMSMLEKCVEASRKGLFPEPYKGRRDIGLGLDNTSDNKHVVLGRLGPCIAGFEEYHLTRIGDICKVVDFTARKLIPMHVCFDERGIGAGVRAWFDEKGELPYLVRPSSDGVARGMENLHVRARFTERLLLGENINTDNCLFISADMPELDRLLNALVDREAGGSLHDATMLALSVNAPWARGEVSEFLEKCRGWGFL